ncbi:MAG: hypothetical protein Tsb0020_37960 [Haliangiales bacterium]
MFARIDGNIRGRICRGDNELLDITAIVDGCLSRPRGLFELMESVHWLEGDSYAWRAVESYLIDVPGFYEPLGTLFTVAEVQQVEALIRAAALTEAELGALRGQIEPRSKMAGRARRLSLPLLLAELCLLSAPRDGAPHPLIRFVSRASAAASDPGAARALREWVRAVCQRHGLSPDLGPETSPDIGSAGDGALHPTPDASSEASSGGSYLLIVLRPVDLEIMSTACVERHYRAQAWYADRGAASAVPVPLQAQCTAATLPGVLEEAVLGIPEQVTCDPHLELVVPMELLAQPIDRMVIRDGFESKPIGALYRLVMRSYERLMLPRWARIRRNEWRARWNFAREPLDAPAHQLSVQPAPVSVSGDDLNRVLGHDDNCSRPCVVFNVIPEPTDLGRVLDAGISIALWPRESLEQDVLLGQLRALMFEPLGSLPERLLALRRQKALQGALVLLWDHPGHWSQELNAMLRAPTPS